MLRSMEKERKGEVESVERGRVCGEQLPVTVVCCDGLQAVGQGEEEEDECRRIKVHVAEGGERKQKEMLNAPLLPSPLFSPPPSTLLASFPVPKERAWE